MQSPYTEQAYGQYPSSTPSPNSSTGYPPPGVTDFMTPVFSKRVAPSYNAQSYTNQDIYRDHPGVRTGPEYGNDARGGGSISGYGSYHAMAGSWGTPTLQRPQPLQNGDHSMPSIPHSSLRQDEPYYAGYHFGTEQVPGPTMSFSPRLPEAGLNDQDAFSEWRSHTGWVSRPEEDEIHLTYGNGGYGGGSISGYGSNHAGGAWGAPAPQSLQNSDYSMPSIPYSALRQDEPYYTGCHFSTEQVPGPTMSFSPRFPEASPNQDAPSEWRFHTCWVSHAQGDEIHLTIALKKSS